MPVGTFHVRRVTHPFPDLAKKEECDSRKFDLETTSPEKAVHGSFTAHHFGLIVAAITCNIAVSTALFLILRHATHYLKPYEQKHIIRILVMVPIYAVVSFLSCLFYHQAVYFNAFRDCYEAFAIASFFTLMCHYIAPNLHEQKAYFRNIRPKNWVWPLSWVQKCTGGEEKGWLRRPRSGLTWFNIVYISVFQYCLIRPFFTLVAVISHSQYRYCQDSTDPRYAHVWVAGFNAISVMIAMYCMTQFYVQLKQDLAPYRPFLKFLCIKLVIFFCFWQTSILSLVTTRNGPLKPTDYFAGPDLRVSYPAMLICVEMVIFAVMHTFAFPWKPYDLDGQSSLCNLKNCCHVYHEYYFHGPAGAILDAFNPWDIIKACGRGSRWLFVGVRRRKIDSSYHPTNFDLTNRIRTRNTAHSDPTYCRKRRRIDRHTAI